MKINFLIKKRIKVHYEINSSDKGVLAQMLRIVEVHEESARKHASLKRPRVPNRFRSLSDQRVFAFRREAVLQEPV